MEICCCFLNLLKQGKIGSHKLIATREINALFFSVKKTFAFANVATSNASSR
jgi:hypothetical protein